MSSTIQPRDPYSRAVSELKELSKQIGSKQSGDFLLRCDKKGHFSIEEKSVLGKIKRFFTVTLFRSKEYNFDANIQKIGKLFELARSASVSDPELQDLETKINELISSVVQKKRSSYFFKKSLNKPESEAVAEKIVALQQAAHTVHKPISSENLQTVEDLKARFETLSFVDRRNAVMRLADEMQGFVYDSSVSKEAYLENLSWLAGASASFFEFEVSFALYKKAIEETGLVGRDHATLNQFVEIGLLLKRFTVIEKVVDTLPAQKKAHPEILKRVKRVQSFAEGDVQPNGFKENEWKMLTLFAEAYRAKEDGFKGLKKHALEIRDFLIYAAGNGEFNKRLKTQLENDSVIDESILSAIDYFATFSFKSDPVKWKSNQVYVEHMSKVQELYNAKEQLEYDRQLLTTLETAGTKDAPKFIAKDGDRGLRAIEGTTYTQVENIPGKKTKFTHTKPRQKVTKLVFAGSKAMTANEWKKEQTARASEDIAVTKERLKASITSLEEKIMGLQKEVNALGKQYPKIVGKKPEKMQMVELPVLDSIYRFHEQLTEDMRTSFDLDNNPFFKAEAQSLANVTRAYEWIQERTLGGNGYHTGDYSFVNELKKAEVTGKAPADFTDKAAVALFPYGHLAIIDEDHGSVAFSHQRLAFDHSPISLAELLYYDTYRFDFSKIARPEAFDAIVRDFGKRVLQGDVEDGSITKEQLAAYPADKLEALERHLGNKTIADAMRARNMTKEQFLLNELEERFAQKVADELEQAGKIDETKWQGVERPDFTKVKTLNDLKAWLDEVNAGRENKFELYELFEIPDDCEPEVERKIQELRVDYLRDLYKALTNDEKTQADAFIKSWLFAGPLRLTSPIRDKEIDPRRVEMMGEMCCSQFAQLIALRALDSLDREFQELRGTGDDCLDVPKLTEKKYAAGTTEFVLKEYKHILRPIQAPTVMHEMVDLPRRNFLKPIAIDSTVAYMAKRLRHGKISY